MAEFKMTQKMEMDLDKFLSSKTITDVDRTKFLPLVLVDSCNKLTTCLMFNCNCHSYEDPTVIPCQYSGAVIHLPAFWVEVPKELAMTYIKGLIDELYGDTYKDWKNAGQIGPDSSGCGCSCPANNWTPTNLV